MASAALRSGRKLRAYVDELKKITEEAETYLSTCAVQDGKQSNDSLWLLRKSFTLLSKCLSRIQEKQNEIELRFAKELEECEGELCRILDSVDPVQVHAEMVLAEVEAKLSYFDSVGSRLPSSPETIASESGMETKIASLESIVSELETKLKRSLELTENKNLLSNAVIEHTMESISALKFVPAEEESKENSQVSVSASDSGIENNDQTGSAEEQPCREFNLTRFYNDGRSFKSFLLEFQDTVGKSPLEIKYKFAALRSMIRGDLYKLFLDLDYRKDEDYRKALLRLCFKFFNEFPLDEIDLDSPSRPMPSFAKVKSSYSGPGRWSDEYFLRRYCHEATNYEKPNRSLLTRAIHAFLNLYVVGPKRTSNHDFFNVWLILLHGVKFQDRYMVDSTAGNVFERSQRVTFPSMDISSKENLFKFAPCLLKKKVNDENKPKQWIWTYFSHGEGGTRHEDHVTTKTVKQWYRTCWDSVLSCDDETFQHWVNYFALLTVVLFRVTIKELESVEQYVVFSFNRLFKVFCPLQQYLPKVVPPHSGVYKLIRKSVFKKHSANFKKYLTYLVGCYAFSRADSREVIRNFLNAGCLLTFLGSGLGSIYWLRKAAEYKLMKPQDLLTFFLIDPSMENQVKNVHLFLQTYRREVTWWWARLFENSRFKEVSTAHCPAFAFACFIVQSPPDAKIETCVDFPQFSRFLKNDISAGLSGKNLGVAVRDLINEWNDTPLSFFTKGLHKRKESGRCCP